MRVGDAAESWLTSRSDLTKRRVARVLIAIGLAIVPYYASWWFEHGRVYNPFLLLALLFAIVYHGCQVLTAWLTYLRVTIPASLDAPPGLTIDVFIPVYDEPDDLVAACLRAAIDMHYPHRTYLLDDRPSGERRALAHALGVEYLTRSDNQDAKAGNVNHALARTDGEFVLIFDVDHVPAPTFLDRVLGHFADPQVGFVQALVAHGNQAESFVALAAADQAYDIFSPTSMGMHGLDAATVWGAHCTFRRAALASIGGHQVGLAEDLHTSLALHAAGWRSVYVPEVLARGLVPADLLAYVKQQLKWSRGVFAVLFERSPALLPKLRPLQALCYLMRMTYYLIGLVTLINISFTVLVLLGGSAVTSANFVSYLAHWLPLMLMVILVRKAMLVMWERDQQAVHASMAGVGLAFGMWPVHVLALLCAILRVRVPHIATPKRASGGNYLPLVIPQIIAVALLLTGIGYRLIAGANQSAVVVILFAVLNIASHVPVLYAVWEGWVLALPHRAIDLTREEAVSGQA